MKSETFGTRPTVDSVANSLSFPFYYELKGEDEETARRAGIPDFITKGEGAWIAEFVEIVNKLIDAWEKGDENAGSLASAFMSLTGVEWI